MHSILKVLKLILMAAWAGLIPVHSAIITALSLPAVDLVLALTAAKRAGVPVTSSGIKRSVAKVVMYEAGIILAFVVESFLLGGYVPVTRMVTGLIGMTELKSCLEHLDDLGGNKLFATIITKLAPPQPPNDESIPK